jgi:glycosyltransferase involved in cell wall biosynthesis
VTRAPGPTVSVVVPVHDAAAFLPLSVGSALAQTLQSLELVCVDDGSSDSSVDVLHSLALTDPRVRVVELADNRGPSAARNAGIDAATGEYVCFLDADDELPPRALERLLTAARRSGCALAVGRLDWRREASDPPQPLPGDGELSVTTAHVADSAVLQSVPGCHCCNLYDRELLDRHGIRYATDLSLGEDQLFQATAIAMAGRVAMIDEVVYVYHHYRGTSITRRRPNLGGLMDDVEYQRRIARLFIARGLGDAGIRRLENWSYSIQEYWLQIPDVLSVAEAGRFFADFRSVGEEFGITPWTEATPQHHRHFLQLVVDGEDQLALAYLASQMARTGTASAGSMP